MKLTVTIGGTDHRLEFDPARTPLLIRAPFPLGTFALELVR